MKLKLMQRIWAFDSRIRKALRLDDSIQEEKMKPNKKHHWLFTIFLLGLSGVLGWWATLTMWNCGIKMRTSLFIGSVEPLTGFLVLLTSIVSVFMLDYAMETADDFDTSEEENR